MFLLPLPHHLHPPTLCAPFLRRLVTAFNDLGGDELRRAFALCEVRADKGLYDIHHRCPLLSFHFNLRNAGITKAHAMVKLMQNFSPSLNQQERARARNK